MAENIISIDPKLVAEIEAAAQQIGVSRFGDREDDEFTAEEFGAIMNLGVRQAYTLLHRAIKDGKMARREWRKGPYRTFLYRKVDGG